MRRAGLPTHMTAQPWACTRYSQSTHGREDTSFHLWSVQLAVLGPAQKMKHTTPIGQNTWSVFSSARSIHFTISINTTTYSTTHGQIVKHPPATRAGTTPPLSLRAQHAPGPTSGLPGANNRVDSAVDVPLKAPRCPALSKCRGLTQPQGMAAITLRRRCGARLSDGVAQVPTSWFL